MNIRPVFETELEQPFIFTREWCNSAIARAIMDHIESSPQPTRVIQYLPDRYARSDKIIDLPCTSLWLFRKPDCVSTE